MTANDVLEYIRRYKRVTGKLPKLREVVEAFDGKLLNVMMCLSEIDPVTAGKIKQIARYERKTNKRK